MFNKKSFGIPINDYFKQEMENFYENLLVKLFFNSAYTENLEKTILIIIIPVSGLSSLVGKKK